MGPAYGAATACDGRVTPGDTPEAPVTSENEERRGAL